MIANDIADVIERIETEYDVNSIRYVDTPIWQYIRTYVFFSYQNNDEPSFQKRMSYHEKVMNFLRAMSRTDFRLFMKRSPVIMFVDGEDICTVDEKKRTKLFETVRKMYGNRCVPIVIPVENIKGSPYKHYIDTYVLSYFLRKVRKKLEFDESLLEGREIIQKIIKELGIPDFDYIDIIKKILAAKIFFRKWFGRVRPIKVFVSCYYDYNRMPAISIAKEMDIKTIEFQHGYIGYDHAAYRSCIFSSREAYPDYFFSFGEKFSKVISKGIYPSEAIFEVGNNYLELMSGKQEYSRALLRRKYPKIKEKKVLCIVGEAMEYYDMHRIKLGFSLLDNTDGFAVIFKPRYAKTYDVTHDDFYFEDEMDVYQCMQASDVTLVGLSTCAFESLYMGIPVVLDNIDNLAKKRFENYFGDIHSISYVEGYNDIVEAVKQLLLMEKQEVKREGKLFYTGDNKRRVRQAIEKIDAL